MPASGHWEDSALYFGILYRPGLLNSFQLWNILILAADVLNTFYFIIGLSPLAISKALTVYLNDFKSPFFYDFIAKLLVACLATVIMMITSASVLGESQ